MTPSRLYEFIGPSNYDMLFQGYDNRPVCVEIPSTIDYSELSVIESLQRAGASSDTVAWLTQPGVVLSKLIFGSQDRGDKIIGESVSTNMIRYGGDDQNDWHGVSPKQVPVTFALSQFHILLFYDNLYLGNIYMCLCVFF